MKKYLLYGLAILGLLGTVTGCDDFGNVNDDPEHLNDSNMDYTLMFTQVQSQIAGSDWDVWRNSIIYSANMMQHTSSVNWSEGVFYTWNSGFNSAFWDGYYSGGRAAIRNINIIIDKWTKKGGLEVEVQFARVMRAYMFQIMTDLYGDVPYTEASIPSIGQPKYDKQEFIYTDLLEQLAEVNKILLERKTDSNVLTSADVIFNGKSESWRKFSNSLMLRLAMRLSKVDPDKAKEYATLAVNNGLYSNVNESAFVKHNEAIVTNDSAEPFGKVLSNEDPEAFFVSEYFINALKETNDPRIHLIATKTEKPGEKWSSKAFDFGDSSDIDKLIGLPIGYETKSGDWDIKDHPNFPTELGDNWRPYYAFPNRRTFANPTSPSMLVTHAENLLLLADATVRNIISGNAKEYFKQGVQAAMEQFSLYNDARAEYTTYLTSEKVTEYINSRMAAFDANPLKEINWQYYIVTFGSEYETFANWRRTGFPELKSVYEAPHNRPAYPNNISKDIPRRFTYDTGETSSNRVNYQDAVKRLKDGDKMTSRVWWDAE